MKTSKGKNPHVGIFKGKAAQGTSNEVLLVSLGWKLLGKESTVSHREIQCATHHVMYLIRLAHGKWLDDLEECFVHCKC